MSSQKVSFPNSEGQMLSGNIELPLHQKPKAFALFAHCFTCSKNLNAVRYITNALTDAGYGVLRFDFTGLGQSEGDFSDTNFSSNVNDLVSAGKYLSKKEIAPQLLVGHSLGGAAVIFAANEIESIKAVATIGAPASPQHVSHLFEHDLEEIATRGRATVDLGGRKFEIKDQFIADIIRQDLPSIVKDFDKALLVLHSPQDATVGINNASEIYQAAKHPKSFVTLDGADHLLSHSKDSHYVGTVIAQWATRYLDLEEEPTLQSDHQVVSRTGADGYTTDIKAGIHTLLADEPESIGGDDLGPTPYDLLLSALGACTSMTVQMYARRKGWPLEDVVVHLNHKKDHASDSAQSEKGTSKIDHIDKHLEFKGPLSEEQKNRLLEIAERCPVNRTLHNEIEVHSGRL